MYNLEQLEEYAQKIYDRYDYFNEYTLETIGRRIKETGRLSAYDQEALKNIADISGDMEAITKELARITEMNIKDIEAVYTQVIKDGQNTYKPLYDFKGMRQIPLAENDYLQKIVNSWAVRTEGKMINLSRTKSLCFDSYDAFGNVTGSIPLAGAYEQAMSEAVQAVSSGTVDFNTAMRKTVERMGGSGVRVNYGNGVTRNLSSAIRQNVLWGAKKTAQDYESYVGEELGLDGFEVDAHAGCRPSHLFMQGQIYSYKGDKTVNGVTYKDGSRALEAMTDYGCLHFKISVLLGVSESRYSTRELARIERESTELIEYNGRQKTLYEWKQTQRTLERGVKKAVQQGNMLEAAGNHTAAKQYADKAKQFRRAYDDMCAGVPGLEPRLERMRVYKNVSGKTVDNYGKSGIIGMRKYKIMSINNIDSPIEQRNTAKGNPNAILQIGRPLNNRQQRLLENLNEYDSKIIVNKKTVNMKDLSAMTAFTGDEFALFTKGGERLVIRGNANSVNIDSEKAAELSKQGYKWSGHTHPGVEKNCSMPSAGDKEILKCFKQKMSVIYDSKGQYRTFEKE